MACLTGGDREKGGNALNEKKAWGLKLNQKKKVARLGGGIEGHLPAACGGKGRQRAGGQI